MRTFFLQLNIFAILAVFLIPTTSFGMMTTTQNSTPAVRFNNENWFTIPHPKVASFSVHADGSASGFLETGVPFSQVNVPNDLGIRIQRFELEDHYHYIVEGEIAYTQAELSVKLAQAYAEKQDNT
jgi:hypothetical protein